MQHGTARHGTVRRGAARRRASPQSNAMHMENSDVKAATVMPRATAVPRRGSAVKES